MIIRKYQHVAHKRRKANRQYQTNDRQQINNAGSLWHAQRIQRAKEQATETQVMQVMRDICVIAMTEGNVTVEERNVLNSIADGLGISRTFICQTIEEDCEPD